MKFKRLGMEYLITQWITGKPGKVIRGPGLRFLPPFLLPVQRNGVDVKLSMRVERRDVRVAFATKGDLSGKLQLTYSYIIPTSTDAWKFYWLRNADLELVDRKVMDELIQEISIRDARGIREARYVVDVINSLNRENNSLYETLGIKIEEIDVQYFEFGSEEKSILRNFAGTQEEVRALMLRINAEAEGIVRKAQAESIKRTIKAETTLQNVPKYLNAGEQIYEKGSSGLPGDIALYLIELDHEKDLAEKGKIITIKLARR